jgi:hypothetical protein
MDRLRQTRPLGQRAAGLVGLALVSVSTAACALLYSGFDEDFPQPSPIATYSKGTATLTLEDGTKVVLDKLNAGPHVWTVYGSEVRWSGSSGWHVRVGGAGETADYLPKSISFDRIADGQHWTTFSYDACDIDISVADATSLRGTATCEGLRWSDALAIGPMGPSGPIGEDPPYVPDQSRFDVTVSFEATR